ncbi:unknown (plasmid) [Haloarcula marismortui ATCC 43049]|uniref:Uncharacterized protein n=2 Tax=Haloarcula marismortui TaxID=2238 RepID=Q5V7Y8_HALMA|nr:unknown [Haloarcula marismortui ATCC 43049]
MGPNMAKTEPNEPKHRTESVSEVLAEMTGRPVSEFEADEHDFPDLDDLETVPEDEW